MTTAEDLRLAMRTAVADPPPMSDDLVEVLVTGRHVPRRRRRNTFLAGVVVVGATAAAIAAFSKQEPPEKRTGLEQYNPAAIQAAREDSGDEPFPRSNQFVIGTMEVRYACQSAYEYLEDPSDETATVLERRLRSADRAAGPQIRAFTDFVRKRLDQDVGRTGHPVADLVGTECPAKDRLEDPIHRGGP